MSKKQPRKFDIALLRGMIFGYISAIVIIAVRKK